MPGILGIFGQPDVRNQFNRMVEDINHRDYQIEAHHTGEFSIGRVHLGFVNKGRQPVFSEDKRYGIVMTGEIYSYDGFETGSIGNDANFLLDIFTKSGINCLPKINGQFSAAICDMAEKKIVLISDRYGTRPLYYRTSKSKLVFAPEIKALLGPDSKPKINHAAIWELFHIGFLFGNHTMLEDVNQLPPASYLQFKDGKYLLARYWEYPYEESVYHQTRFSKKQIGRYREELQATYTNVIRRQSFNNSGNLLLPLSGGLDSRWVAALLHETGIENVQCFTMGESESDDVVYARMVAEKLGYPHRAFRIDPRDIWKNAEFFSFVSDGMSKISGPIQMTEPIKSFIGQKQIILAPQVLDAVFGSTLYRPRVASLIGKRTYSSTIKNTLLSVFDTIPTRDVRKIFTNSYFNHLENHYHHTLTEYIEKYHDPLHAYFCMFMEQFGRRGTFGGNLLYNQFFETRMPSYDNDLIEFGFRLPIKLRKGQYLYRLAFTQKFPELSAIPRDKSGLPISSSNTRVYLKQVQSKLISGMKRTPLRGMQKRISRWNKPHYVNYEKWFRDELREDLVGLLYDKRTQSRGIFNKDNVENVLAEHNSGKKDHSPLLWQIVNLEYTYRNLID